MWSCQTVTTGCRTHRQRRAILVLSWRKIDKPCTLHRHSRRRAHTHRHMQYTLIRVSWKKVDFMRKHTHRALVLAHRRPMIWYDIISNRIWNGGEHTFGEHHSISTKQRFVPSFLPSSPRATTCFPNPNSGGSSVSRAQVKFFVHDNYFFIYVWCLVVRRQRRNVSK